MDRENKGSVVTVTTESGGGALICNGEGIPTFSKSLSETLGNDSDSRIEKTRGPLSS